MNAGNYCKPRDLTKIIGSILAIHSVQLEAIKEYMKVFDKIDVGCAIKTYSFLVNRNENNVSLLHVSGREKSVNLLLDYFRWTKLETVADIDIRKCANGTLDDFDISDN